MKDEVGWHMVNSEGTTQSGRLLGRFSLCPFQWVPKNRLRGGANSSLSTCGCHSETYATLGLLLGYGRLARLGQANGQRQFTEKPIFTLFAIYLIFTGELR
ncbi:hypothetical protein L211DRAFT_526335 [Terfezia boudieri ATCC MYA-4762]|uniref:Uncharacterized protein n=1 Tax=Terfezia boudieri ATCC MYA-4762 TaxID=1051890 RepID=A0A3N4LC83_9PEZI|nr:hypothetical protein L211DRAFT_526335 [Terfezia boudieri ATCC MYA-4762]